jgi:hypothetical protein
MDLTKPTPTEAGTLTKALQLLRQGGEMINQLTSLRNELTGKQWEFNPETFTWKEINNA